MVSLSCLSYRFLPSLGSSLVEQKRHYRALEFFAGIGLARAGMDAAGIDTVWANDFDDTKRRLYSAQWGGSDFVFGDVFDIDVDSVPDADIAWASSPCTDLSLAGKRGGLVNGRESKAFFGFVDVIERMGDRAPFAVVLENVCGLASSHDGDDFRMVVSEFNRLGYSVDAFELNARRWIPQSRPRMFVVGVKRPIGGGKIDTSIRSDRVAWIHSDPGMVTHVTPVGMAPALLDGGLTDVVERLDADDPRWWESERVDALVESLSSVQLRRLEALCAADEIVARTAYRRTRRGVPVWEIRGDDISGCLRTARGGSSKQAVVVAGRGEIRVRWMTALEYARLQGAGEFDLSGFRDSQVRYAFGDAVAVPVVTWLMNQAVLPALEGRNDG